MASTPAVVHVGPPKLRHIPRALDSAEDLYIGNIAA